jgi:3-deoxy-D-manno-octulosonic acid (KDO) 8-phosphate synthase
MSGPRFHSRTARARDLLFLSVLAIVVMLPFARPNALAAQAQQVDEAYTAKILEYTTEPFFLTPHVAVGSATLDELLMASEYVLKEGNTNVMLCERGIRTFETATRFTLDLSAVIVAKRLTDLPVIVDPSHAAGRRDLATGIRTDDHARNIIRASGLGE